MVSPVANRLRLHVQQAALDTSICQRLRMNLVADAPLMQVTARMQPVLDLLFGSEAAPDFTGDQQLPQQPRRSSHRWKQKLD